MRVGDQKPGGGLPYWVIQGMCGYNRCMSFRGQKSAGGCEFPPEKCRRVIISLHKISGLVTISITLHGNGRFLVN